jgi:hypothetical protein
VQETKQHSSSGGRYLNEGLPLPRNRHSDLEAIVENTRHCIFQSESKVAAVLFPSVEETVDALGGGLENRHFVRSGADVSTVVAFGRVTVKHLSTSRWNVAWSNCYDSLPASRLPVLIRTMPNWTSESLTIRPEQLREHIRKDTELIRRS